MGRRSQSAPSTPLTIDSGYTRLLQGMCAFFTEIFFTEVGEKLPATFRGMYTQSECRETRRDESIGFVHSGGHL